MTLQHNRVWTKTLFEVRIYNYFRQTTSLCAIPIRGALPGSDRLLLVKVLLDKRALLGDKVEVKCFYALVFTC